MKQLIRPGGTIDALTQDELVKLIPRERDVSYWRTKGAFALNAAGGGQDSIDVSSEYDFFMERVCIGGAGAVNALAVIYADGTQASDMIEVVQLGAAGLYSDSFSNCAYVSANSQIIIVVTGGVANGNVQYNYQIRRVRRTGAR